MIKKILFPVDFSPACAAMAGYVGRAATIFGARVALLHVAHLASHDAFEIVVRPVPEIEEEHRSLAQERLNAFLQAEFPATESERFLAFGDAADEITHMANAGAFDLIIMLTHAGRFRRMLLGSTTAKVLIDADCPLLTSEHAEAMVPKPLENRTWLCAISLNDDSERVLRAAAEAAEATGARLSVIHAIQVSRLGLPRELVRDDELDLLEARDARRRAEELQRTVGSNAPFQITVGPSVKEALLEAVRRSGTDMFIIERRGQHDLAYQVVRDSPVTVLSI
ncbi:MAG TPA: universal stress protein [Candidatus Binatus sp.]|nr:universal stress protein [Candidatus Binatus sp.]